MRATGKQLETQLKDFLRQVAEAGRDGLDPRNLPPIFETRLRHMLGEEVSNYSDFLVDNSWQFLVYDHKRKSEIEGR